MTVITQPTRRLGYSRVGTYGQTLEAQLDQLRAEECARIYREKASGGRRPTGAIRQWDLLLPARIK